MGTKIAEIAKPKIKIADLLATFDEVFKTYEPQPRPPNWEDGLEELDRRDPEFLEQQHRRNTPNNITFFIADAVKIVDEGYIGTEEEKRAKNNAFAKEYNKNLDCFKWAWVLKMVGSSASDKKKFYRAARQTLIDTMAPYASESWSKRIVEEFETELNKAVEKPLEIIGVIRKAVIEFKFKPTPECEALTLDQIMEEAVTKPVIGIEEVRRARVDEVNTIMDNFIEAYYTRVTAKNQNVILNRRYKTARSEFIEGLTIWEALGRYFPEGADNTAKAVVEQIENAIANALEPLLSKGRG